MSERPPLTRLLAETCARLGSEGLPEDVRRGARRALLDGIACMIAGAGEREIAPISLLAQELGAGDAPVLGRAQRLTPAGAALLNGCQAHALELDDTHSLSSVHGAGPVIGSALSAASWLLEQRGERVSGARLLAAVAAGYEACCRPGAAARGTDPYARGFHPTGIYGIFGAAAAAAVLFGGAAEEIAAAFGVAGSQGAGSMAYLQNGAWTKRLHAGWAAFAGFGAARLAALGLRAPDRIFEGLYDYLAAHSPEADASPFLAQLGERVEVTHLSYKPFACCRSIHPAVTAVLRALEDERLDRRAIARIDLTICDEDLALIAEPAAEKRSPRTSTEAQFSLYWGVAAAVVTGDAGLSAFNAHALGDERIRRLAQRVFYTTDAELTRRRPRFFPCRARVADERGSVVESAVDAPLGDDMNPLSDEALERKAYGLLAHRLGDRHAAMALDVLRSLPESVDVLQHLERLEAFVREDITV